MRARPLLHATFLGAAFAAGAAAADERTLAAIGIDAHAEGQVVVWSVSSRLSETGRLFEKTYGIRCTVRDTKARELLDAIGADARTNGAAADVYLLGDAPDALATVVAQGLVVPFLTAATAEALPPELQEGLPAHHLSGVGLVYDGSRYAHPPIASWWDLTTPTWRGRVAMKALSEDGGDLNLFTAFVQYGDVLARDYRARFGADLPADAGNAGYELLRRLLANDPIFTRSGSDAAAMVARGGKDRSLVGIMTLGQVGDAREKGLPLAWAEGITPASGLAQAVLIGIARDARHPNAAKLFVEFALGREGFAPFLEYGTWPAREDAATPEGMEPFAESGFWLVDPVFSAKERPAMRAFLAAHARPTAATKGE